jgi:hypothetical protein
MNRFRVLWFTVIAAASIVSSAGNALAQTAKDLLGTWTLVSISGDPDGPSPKGMLMFDAGGRFIQLITRSDVPKYASGKRAEGTAEEFKATVLGSLGFFGTYSVTGTNLMRHVDASSYPNLVGTDQNLSNLTLSGDDLKWSNASPLGVAGDPIVVTWKRAQ